LDPPRGERAEPVPPLGVKAFYRTDEPHVAFFDQVNQGKPAAPEVLRNADNQAKIAQNKPVSGLPVIALTVSPGKFEFFFPAQKRETADPREIALEG
jgi:hypothetical protein